MIRNSVLIGLTLMSVAGRQSIVAVDPPRCLALAWGAWHPPEPNPRWRATRLLTLLDTRDSSMDQIGGRVGWRAVLLEPFQQGAAGDTSGTLSDSVWLWLAPTFDSLVLTRPGIESPGLEIHGRWHADTLVGRAHAFRHYATSADEPVAAVYAVRYRCGNAIDRVQALISVELLRATASSKSSGPRSERGRARAVASKVTGKYALARRGAAACQLLVLELANDRVQVQLDCAHSDRRSRTGQAAGVLSIVNGSAVYRGPRAGGACVIRFHFRPRRVEVTQADDCDMGPGVNANGTYHLVSRRSPRLDEDPGRYTEG